VAENTNKIDHDGHHPQKVTIVVDGVKHEVRPGPWIVSELKAAVGVPAAKVLAEITPQGLKDLEDGATITVHEGQRFMSHVRTGGSS
jgi:hypothetical protein